MVPSIVERALRALGWCGNVVWADTFLDRLLGMTAMFPYDSRGIPIILVIPRCHAVHTCAMRYPLDIAFADEHGNVIALHEGVAPGRFLSESGASFVLERPSAMRSRDRVAAAPMLAA